MTDVNWNLYHYTAGVSDIAGKVPVEIKQELDELIFIFSDGTAAKLYHEQDCCESVTIDDVNGDWNDLLNVPLLVAEERSGEYAAPEYADSYTWTFYTFRSINGSVDMRWLGESNGYYSEGVDFAVSENWP